MKGIIFNTLEDFIVEGWGEDTFEDIFSSCPLETKEPFVGPGTYPDADLVMIVGATCKRLGIPAPDALRAFGVYLFPKLVETNPDSVKGYDHPQAFLLSVHDIIHVEVRKLYPKAITPEFRYHIQDEHSLQVEYHSKRGFCHLMEGLLEGAAAFFGYQATHEQLQCTHKGATHCLFEVHFTPTNQD